MRIRSKIEILLVVVLIVFVALSYSIQRYIVYESFLRLEEAEALEDLQRCIEAVGRESYHLVSFFTDWAVWDDTYQFVQDGNEDYVTSNMTDDTFTVSQIDLMFFLNLSGEVVWGKIMRHQTGEVLSSAFFPPDRWPDNHPLLMKEETHEAKMGIVLTEHGPMIVGASCVFTSNDEGPYKGTVVMGRFLDAEVIETLVGQTRVQFMVWPVDEGTLPEEERQVLNTIPENTPLVLRDADDDVLRVYQTYPDIEGHAALLIRASVPRQISAKGRVAMSVSLISIAAVGLLVLLALRLFLARAVTGPLTRLTRGVTGIASSQDLSSRVRMARPDEIGVLAGEFNNMLERLEQDSRERERLAEELRQMSRQDGLTGLCNRRYFDEMFKREWDRALRAQEPLSVIMTDVDHFKAFNDNYGHQRGDYVLREVASALRTGSRRSIDIVARYGGEEFVVLLSATERAGAAKVAEDLRVAVESMAIPHGHSIAGPHVTISLGVATIIPQRDSTPESLVAQADLALYRAKEAGRNRVVVIE